MASRTLLRRRPLVAIAGLVIAGIAFLAYAQYQSSVTSRTEAARRAELFKARDAIDAQLADAKKGPLPVVPGDKGTAR